MKKYLVLGAILFSSLVFARNETIKENVCIVSNISNQFMTRFEVQCESKLSTSIKLKTLWGSDSRDPEKQRGLKEDVLTQMKTIGFHVIGQMSAGATTILKKSVDGRVEPLKQVCIAGGMVLGCSADVKEINQNLLANETVEQILERDGFRSIGSLVYGNEVKNRVKIFVR